MMDFQLVNMSTQDTKAVDFDSWNATIDEPKKKRFVEGANAKLDWCVTFEKRGGTWSYIVSGPGHNAESDMCLSVGVGASLSNARADAEAVTAREKQ